MSVSSANTTGMAARSRGLCRRAAPAILALTIFLGGCGGTGSPSIRLALDGPPLHVAASGGNHAFTGVMDRSCMAGLGAILLINRAESVSCRGTMDRPANDKGRLYADLACSDGSALSFVMRNLGPDQGMGIGRDNETGERITLFYHACEDEAARRLESLLQDIDDAVEKKRRQEEEMGAVESGE